ncbi:MAG: lysophospholipid acyltransferase family protein [Vicinamibacteria bacterium]|nr:lysophospholipid acyltransferase family protein [Vicinamibacteria bacterium]
MNKKIRHYCEDTLAGFIGWSLSLFPRGLVLPLGRALGRLWASADQRHLAIASDNLRRAFPEWAPARWRVIAQRVYAHFGQTLLDILWMARQPREVLMALGETEGREHVLRAMAAGRGLIIFTAHFGHWELFAVLHGWAFGPVSVVGRPLDNPRLDARLTRFRGKSGNEVISKHRALGQILRRLKAGGTVAMLIDQNVQEQDGIFVDFFGRPAATTTVAAALALKTGCALIPAHNEILSDGRCRMRYEAPLALSPAADRQAEIARATQETARSIERWERECPEQWLWLHRRWKTQPTSASAAAPAGGDA